MWLATLEDGEGMWVSDPIGGDTREQVEKIALTAFKWAADRPGYAIMLYACSHVCELEQSSEVPSGEITAHEGDA